MGDESRWIFAMAIAACFSGAGSALGQGARQGQQQPVPVENLPPGIVAETFDTRVEGHRDLTFYLRKPRAGAVAPGGVMAICTVGERRIAIDLTERSPHFAHLLALADRRDLAVIAFGQPSTGGAWDRRVSTQDLAALDAGRLGRTFDALAREWARLIGQFARKHSLPERGYLLYGICGGAQYAHRLALRQPQLFRAVHAHYGGSYDAPTRGGRDLLWLITTYEDDAGHLPSQRFFVACAAAGYRMILKAYPRGATARRSPG